MRILKKNILVICSVILCITVLWQTVSAAVTGSETLYVKDMKLIYADSVEEAKDQLPKGYNLVEGDINSGTGELGVYICYTTTQNRDEAITDIKVMHESGGFKRTDFKSSLDEAIDGVYGLAQEMITAINEFVQNYKAGLPAAVYAKEALNYFKYDDSTLLGDFMLSGKGTYKDYGKMILMCHEDILNPILSLLALGVQQKSGENWIDKLANVDPTTYDSSQDAKYRERATKLRPVLQQFNDIYCYVLGYYDKTYTYADLTEENDKELFTQMAENKDLFLVLQSILQSYTVGIKDTDANGEWTAADMFTIGLNDTLNLYESYALLECLTPGQEIMLRLTGPYNFIIGSQNTEEVLAEARKNILKNLDTNEKIPIWEGVNFDLFEHEVGLTNDAQRSISAGKQYDIFAKDVDTLAQKYRDTASIISSSFTIASCSVLVAKCALVVAPKIFSMIGATTVAGAISAFASSAIVTTILTVLGISFTVVSIVCAVFITFFLEDIIAWMLAEDYDRSSIPMYMVDEVQNKEGISTYAYYRRVDNIKTDEQLDLDIEDNESGSDINANEGYRWMALYTSNKSSVGNPIKADFLLETESGVDKDGYVPLSMFGTVNAVNLNSYADKNSSKYPAIYLHYVQDKDTPVESEKIYISHIRAESGIHEDEAKKKLTNSGFIPINHDFGCKEGESTFIGYKLTANPNDAVKDIRLFYNHNGSGVKFGELSYGAMGTIGNFTIMASTGNKNPAPPIVAIKLYEKDVLPDDTLGYEPVNEFSGGMAQPLGREKYRIYFLPEKTFTEGPDYLAGIKTDVYYYNTFSAVTYYKHPFRYFDHTDMFENNADNYRAYKVKNYGEQFFDFSSSVKYYFQAYENADSHNTVNLGYKYTTTKNPYRAIYGLSANRRNGLDRFDDSVTYAKTGYVIAAAEFSSASRLYTGDKFAYSPESNKNEFGKVYSYWNQYIGGYGDYYTSVNSPGKADAWVADTDWGDFDTVHSNNYVFNQDITQAFYCDDMNALYLSGYQSDKTPLTSDDVVITKQTLEKSEASTNADSFLDYLKIGAVTTAKKALEEGKYPSNFTPVCSMIGDSTEPTNVAPSNGEAYAGYYGDALQHKDIYVTLYDKAYMYFRSEKIVDGKAVAHGSLKEGKYISALYLASREEIREEHIKNSKTGEEILCENINKAVVENSLFAKGATTTYRTHINTNFSKSDSFKNANYTYVGIQKSDNPNEAIRDIRLYVAQEGEYPEKKIEREITDNGETFSVAYTLVDRVSLTEQGNKSDADCDKERQVYVYVSSHPSLGAPITEIKMSDVFSYDGFEYVRTMDDKHFFTVYNELKFTIVDCCIFTDRDYFVYGNHLSFKREDAEELPYIQDIKIIGHGSSDEDAIADLFEAGYDDIIAKDMNEGTSFKGQYVYIGMKRTSDPDDAVYDIIANNEQGKNPPETLNQFTLIDKVDLNAKTIFGPYIYLYQTKTKNTVKQYPITDIKAVDENYQTVNTSPSGKEILGPGDITYKEDFVINQDLNKQDFNEGAGGDYIHLVTTREMKIEMQLAYLGSMLGTGSIAVIALFLVAAAGAVAYVKIKKKREAKKNDEIIEEETENL